MNNKRMKLIYLHTLCKLDYNTNLINLIHYLYMVICFTEVTCEYISHSQCVKMNLMTEGI